MSQQASGYRIGWFSSGQGEGSKILLKSIMDPIRRKIIPAEVAFVFCNQPDEAGSSNGFYNFVDHSQALPWLALSFKIFQEESKEKNLAKLRRQYDERIFSLLRDRHFLPVDLVVLAGYKQIVSREMCHKLKMINLHPALPAGPIGTWQQVIWQLIKERAEYSGVTIHLVSPETDRGRPVAWCKFSVRGELFDRHWAEIEDEPLETIKKNQGENLPLFKLLRQEGLKRESLLLVATLRALATDEIRIENGEVLKVLKKGLDLSSATEDRILDKSSDGVETQTDRQEN